MYKIFIFMNVILLKKNKLRRHLKRKYKNTPHRIEWGNQIVSIPTAMWVVQPFNLTKI